MAFHKWDATYWEQQYNESREYINKQAWQIMELQKKLSGAGERLELFKDLVKPVMFIEQGSTANALPAEIYFMYHVIWLKQGYSAPRIYDTLQPLKTQVLNKRA